MGSQYCSVVAILSLRTLLNFRWKIYSGNVDVFVWLLREKAWHCLQIK
jgi:hypothetical protein